MRISLPPLPFRSLIPFERDPDPIRSDILIIGSGSAALRAAIEAGKSRDVLILTKSARDECNSRYSQGGIAATLSRDDTAEDHIGDTLRTGKGICDEEVVKIVVEEGAECVRELIDWGAKFDRDNGSLHFGREGGHTKSRVIHKGDETGLELESTLLKTVAGNPRIRFMENTFVVDLLVGDGSCVGALAYDGKELRAVLASRTLLASGGLARIFRESTNPDVTTGDGIAMALRAGADLMDMEFVQFHPTTLYLAGASRSLISEAVRGAGAVLRDREGVAFMKDVHEMADLAPRDVVSRSILKRMMDTGDTQVYLDASGVEEKFPGLDGLCDQFGLDRDRIPVRPSAHYTIGGVKTDVRGLSSLPGMYAAGECTATGFHGANRLASNSLLECLVFGRRAGRQAAEDAGEIPSSFQPLSGPTQSASDLDLRDLTDSLRSTLWRQIGIERSAVGLVQALSSMGFWSRYVLARRFDGPEGWELQNSLLAAEAIAQAALAREESRGVHYRTDHPESRDEWKKHIIVEL